MLSEEEGIEALARDLSQERGYSLLKITPAHLDLLASSWRLEVEGRAGMLVIGGEELKAGGLKYWQERAKGTRLINEYGPTETVVGCCVYEVERPGAGGKPCRSGMPIANAQNVHLGRGTGAGADRSKRRDLHLRGGGGERLSGKTGTDGGKIHP